MMIVKASRPVGSRSKAFRCFGQFVMDERVKGRFASHDYERYQREKLILVDDKNEEIGSANIVECHLTDFIEKKGIAHRAFSVLLFDQQFRLLLQQRAKTKPIFPLYWANSCCSHPQKLIAGEDEAFQGNGAKRAAVRRIRQELGLEVSLDQLKLQGILLYKARYDDTFSECEMDYLLAAQLNYPVKDVPYNPKEVADCLWLSSDEFEDRLEQIKAGGGKLSPWLIHIQKMGLKAWWKDFETRKAVIERFKDSFPPITDLREKPN